MKLAEALRLRKDYCESIDELRSKLLANCKGRETDEPVEDPMELASRCVELNEKVYELVSKIAMKNASTKMLYQSYFVNRGESNKPVIVTKTLTEALVERDVLKKEIGMYKSMVSSADTTYKRYDVVLSQNSTKEYKIEAKFNVKATEKLIDRLSKFLRILDTKIQEVNWTIDIDFEEL